MATERGKERVRLIGGKNNLEIVASIERFSDEYGNRDQKNHARFRVVYISGETPVIVLNPSTKKEPFDLPTRVSYSCFFFRLSGGAHPCYDETPSRFTAAKPNDARSPTAVHTCINKPVRPCDVTPVSRPPRRVISPARVRRGTHLSVGGGRRTCCRPPRNSCTAAAGTRVGKLADSL